MASNPRIEAVPHTTADPNSRILRFISSQLVHLPSYAIDGKRLLDQLRTEDEIADAKAKAVAPASGSGVGRRKDDALMNGGSSPRTEKSGHSHGKEPSRGTGSGLGSKRFGGIKKQMRDRFGNLPEGNPADGGGGGDSGATGRIPVAESANKENFDLLPASPPTPKVLTRKQMEANHFATKFVPPTLEPMIGELGIQPEVSRVTESTAPKELLDRITRSKRKAQSGLEEAADGGDVFPQVEEKSKKKRRKEVMAEKVVREAGPSYIEVRGIKGGQRVEVDASQEHKARLEARKQKRRAKASILRASPYDTAPDQLLSSRPKPKATPASKLKRRARGMMDVTEERSEQSSEGGRSLIKVSLKPGNTRQETRHASMSKSKSNTIKKSLEIVNDHNHAEDNPCRANPTNFPTSKNIRGLGSLGRLGDGMTRRITLRPVRGVFARGIASANLPVSIKLRSKLAPVPDLAFCESTFLSRPKPTTRQVKERKQSPLARTASSVLPDENKEASECSSAQEGSMAESSDLTSVLESEVEIKVDKGEPSKAPTRGESPSISETSSPRVKTRPQATAAKKPNPPAKHSQSATKWPNTSRERLSRPAAPGPSDDIDMDHTRASPDWPNSLPSTDGGECLPTNQNMIRDDQDAQAGPNCRPQAHPSSDRPDDTFGLHSHKLGRALDECGRGEALGMLETTGPDGGSSPSRELDASPRDDDMIIDAVKDAIFPIVRRTTHFSRPHSTVADGPLRLAAKPHGNSGAFEGSQADQALAKRRHQVGRDPGYHGLYFASARPIDLDTYFDPTKAPSYPGWQKREARLHPEQLNVEQDPEDWEGWLNSDIGESEVGHELVDEPEVDDEQCAGCVRTTAVGQNGHVGETVLDMFGTTEMQARRLWQSGRRIL